MKYKIVAVPLIHYQVENEHGFTLANNDGNNLFETVEEAEKLIDILENEELENDTV